MYFSLLVFFFALACKIMFLLLSIPIAFLHLSSSAILLTTQPLPHPTSRNENGLSKETVFKNFITFFPCSFSISSSLPFLAHLSKVMLTESIFLIILLFNYNLRLTELYYEQVLRFTYIRISK